MTQNEGPALIDILGDERCVHVVTGVATADRLIVRQHLVIVQTVDRCVTHNTPDLRMRMPDRVPGVRLL